MANVALVTAYNDHGQLLIGKRNDNGLYTLAGGHLNPGETPREGAVRELIEETNLSPISISYLTQFTTSEGVNLYCFSALVSGHPTGANDPDQEVETWEWIDPQNIPARIYKHLHGPKDVDDNLLCRLFGLKKAEPEFELEALNKSLIKIPLNKECPHGLKIFLVDGEYIRNHHDSDYTQGGNHFRYKWIPENELWVDDDTPRAEIPFVVVHECHEAEDMRDGMSYDKAHDRAKALEDKYRHKDLPGELNKVQSPPTFPKLGMGDNRREVPIVDSPTALKSKQLSMVAHAARRDTGYTRDELKDTATNMANAGMVSTSPGAATGYSLSNRMRKFKGMYANPLNEMVHETNNAPIATQQHENFHMMMNRVEHKYGRHVRQKVAKHLFNSIDPKDRVILGDYFNLRGGGNINSPIYHEEALAGLHNYLNNPGERDAFHAKMRHNTLQEREIGNAIKRAHKTVRHNAKNLDEGVVNYFNFIKSEDRSLPSDPLISHPNPVERMLALKLNPSNDNLHIASLDHNPLVWQLAVDHPNFNKEIGLKLASSEADSAGNYHGHQIRHILDKPWLDSSHLTAIYDTLDRIKPNDYKDLVNNIGSRPDLDHLLWHKLYHNPDLDHSNRLKLLSYDDVPADVLNNAIGEGIKSESLNSIELGKKAIEHLNVPQEMIEKLIRSAIGSDSESLLSIAAHALTKRSVSDQLINDLQNQAKLRPEHNHARLRLAALSGPGATHRHLDRGMEDPSQYVRNGLMFAPRASAKHINDTIARAVKDKDRNGIKSLLSHPSISGKHLNMLIKHEDGLDYHKVAEMMLGGDLDYKTLKAARLLAGHEADECNYRHNLIAENGNSDVAALKTYGIEPNESNLKALRAIKEIAGLNKAENVIPQPENIINVYPEGLEMAEALKRAFRDSFVFPLTLSGKHSKGAMVARDEASGKSYLLKPGSGIDSPIKGVDQEQASQAVRETAFYSIAKLWGLDHWFVESNLILIDNKEYSVLNLLPWSYETFGRKLKEDPAVVHNVINPLINNGIAFQLAIISYVLANGDQHKNNGMVGKDGEFKLIDNGSSFAGEAFSPSHDTAVFTPFYLIANCNNYNSLDSKERLQIMPNASAVVNQELLVWLNNLDPMMLGTALERFNIDPSPEIIRLVNLKASANVIGVDKAITRLWVLG